MTPLKKQQFIENDLYYELRCLLGAATVWQIYKNNEAGFDVIVAMDSAFVHARNLLVFFASKEKSSNSIRVGDFGVPKPYDSTIYSVWKEPLNRHVLHLNKRRLKPDNLKKSGHLNEKVLVFANEVMRLWEQFENDPEAKELSVTLEAARTRAVKDSRNDAEGRIVPLFSNLSD